MAVTDLIPLVVGLFLAGLAGIRTPAAIQGKNVALWAAHILIAGCLLLAVTPIYSAVDTVFGGTNFANLVSHLAFNVIFLAGCTQVAQSISRPDVVAQIRGGAGLATFLVASTLVTLLFVLADTPALSMGLNLYRDDPLVVLYKVASYIYPAYCSARLVPALYAEARNLASPRIHRWAKGLLTAGFLLVIPVPALHMAELLTVAARPIVDAFLYTAILLVAGGPLLALVARLRKHQLRSKAATYTTAPTT